MKLYYKGLHFVLAKHAQQTGEVEVLYTLLVKGTKKRKNSFFSHSDKSSQDFCQVDNLTTTAT